MTESVEWRIVTTAKYDHQFKKLAKKHYPMEKLFQAINHILADDDQILVTHYDLHSLTGDKQGILEIHIEDNWLLEYMVESRVLTLTLIETGTHQELFGK